MTSMAADLKQRIVVLDDDPTGTQTVHDVPVLTAWTKVDLADALRSSSLLFVLTNSRALSAAESARLHDELLGNLIAAAATLRCDLEIISRSDSTLRGHYPLETDTIRKALEGSCRRVDGEIILPAFFEGGRITVDDVHYVLSDGVRTPAGETEFARDGTFGYRCSNLREWVEEKTSGRVRASDVASVSLDMLRKGGPRAVADLLRRIARGTRVIVNAETYADMEAFVQGLHLVRAEGRRFVYRTAASFVRSFGGMGTKPLLTAEEILPGADEDHGGLIVVGSHVKKSSDQLQALLESGAAAGIEFRVCAVLDGRQEEEIRRCLDAAQSQLVTGRNVVIYTSREVLLRIDSPSEANLSLATKISASLVEIVRRLPLAPRFIIAKGGITSSDVATRGLGVRSATVLGQILPGIPVWRLGLEARFPGRSYVIFPGNVGDRDSLSHIVTRLSRIGETGATRDSSQESYATLQQP